MKTFEDLEFSKRPDGAIFSNLTLDNGLLLSVIAGRFAYSTPKEDGDSADDFASFEIAVIDSRGEFVTREFLFDYHDDILGWQSRDQITELMKTLQS